MTKISRRGFLKLAGATVAIAAIRPVVNFVHEEFISDVLLPYSPFRDPEALVELRNPNVLVAQGWLPIRLDEDYIYKLWLEATKDLEFSQVLVQGPRTWPLLVRQHLEKQISLKEGDVFEMIIGDIPPYQVRYDK